MFTDQAGRFADACEKIDHLEDFRTIDLDAIAAATARPSSPEVKAATICCSPVTNPACMTALSVGA
jgi:hypothetical protein